MKALSKIAACLFVAPLTLAGAVQASDYAQVKAAYESSAPLTSGEALIGQYDCQMFEEEAHTADELAKMRFSATFAQQGDKFVSTFKHANGASLSFETLKLEDGDLTSEISDDCLFKARVAADGALVLRQITEAGEWVHYGSGMMKVEAKLEEAGYTRCVKR